jgi:ATP-dependent Zn protease
LDGFASDDRVKVLAATNRVDVLDPALLRSGRLDRKIEFPLPNEEARAQILRIHSRKMTVDEGVNWQELARSTDEFGGAQLKAVCVEAGMIALRGGQVRTSHCSNAIVSYANVLLRPRRRTLSTSTHREFPQWWACFPLVAAYSLHYFECVRFDRALSASRFNDMKAS